jgi:hypothetical protein
MNSALGLGAPSREALQKQVKRVRREELPVEPDSLENFILPPQYLLTLNGAKFCRQVHVGVGCILIFATTDNMRKLSEANY